MFAAALVIHGGAGPLPSPQRQEALQAALQEIAEATWPMLQAGASALEAAVEAVAQLEDHPIFNAGTGGKLQRDGVARLSASLMCGHSSRFSAVINAEELRNPIRLCLPLLEQRDRVLCGAGAQALARELGFPAWDPRTEGSVAEWRRQLEGQTGTVGAVALDQRGRLAAATSTGGRGMERPGRVSDTGTVAANYASAEVAVSMTGVGEHIMDGGMAVRLVTLVEAGMGLEQAANALLEGMARRQWQAGFIALGRDGAIQARSSTPWLGHAVRR
jgi:L-asparaginase